MVAGQTVTGFAFPPGGLLQVKFVAPEAVMVTQLPEHMDVEGFTVITGLGAAFTVTIVQAEAVQLLAPVTVTQYVVVTVGETFIEQLFC